MRKKTRSPEATAADLLRRYGVNRPPVDVEALATNIGAEVQFEHLEPSVSGLLVKTPEGQARIGVNSLHHRNRQRFTISHEMGHFLLHSDKPSLFVDGQMVYFRENASSESFDLREIQANAFAAELLMPEGFLRADLKDGIDVQDEVAVRKLAERYQVSQQALTLRLLNLGLIAGIDTSPKTRRR